MLDNHLTSKPTLNHQNISRTVGDVCDIFDLISEDEEPDVIVHLASVAIPKLYMKEPDFVIPLARWKFVNWLKNTNQESSLLQRVKFTVQPLIIQNVIV